MIDYLSLNIVKRRAKKMTIKIKLNPQRGSCSLIIKMVKSITTDYSTGEIQIKESRGYTWYFRQDDIKNISIII